MFGHGGSGLGVGGGFVCRADRFWVCAGVFWTGVMGWRM